MKLLSDSQSRKGLALAAVLSLVIVSCGGDDGGEVRDLGGDGTATATGTGTGTGTATGSPTGTATGSPTGTAAAECNPVNSEMEADADTAIEIEALDFAFDPSDIEAETGVITFEVENVGEEAHELAFLPGGGDVPFTEDGVPDEEALEEAGAFELEAFGPGQTCNATYDIPPGEYTIFCIVETDDGTTHYELGMRGTLTVTG